MAYSIKKVSLSEFKDQMVRFYQASGVSPKMIQIVMKEYETVIPHYLAATPETLARKILYAHQHGEIFR